MRPLITALLVAPLLTFAPAAAEAAGTCQGQPATVEASGGTVTGTEGDDVILVTGPADVHALGGRDVVCVVGGTLDAGPGQDRVEMTGSTSLTADLGPGNDDYLSNTDAQPSGGRISGGAGRSDYAAVTSDVGIRIDAPGGIGALPMRGFEGFVLAAPTIYFRGSKRADSVRAVGCAVTLRGGAGSDLLSYANDDWRPTLPACQKYRFRMYGGGGDDELVGWTGRDRLLGGPGRDQANGKQRRDVCRAETERQCER